MFHNEFVHMRTIKFQTLKKFMFDVPEEVRGKIKWYVYIYIYIYIDLMNWLGWKHLFRTS